MKIDYENHLAIKIRKQMVEALSHFNMLKDGDHLMVCVSGGKDSSILLALLKEIQRRAKINFTFKAAILDQKQPGFQIGEFKNFVEEVLDLRLHVIERDTYSIIKEKITDGATYCSLCSRLRRAILYDYAREHGFTKMALGHHRDDLIETTLLNMFYTGKLASMPPKLLSDDGQNIVIRLLCYVEEKDLLELSQQWQFPIIPCNLCGSQEGLKRKRMKLLIKELETEIPHIGSSILTALGHVNPSHLLDKKLWNYEALGSQERMPS